MDRRIGDVLYDLGYVTQEQLELASKIQTSQNGNRTKLGLILLQLGYVNRSQVTEAVCIKLGKPITDCSGVVLTSELKKLVPKTMAYKLFFMPLGMKEGILRIATFNPFNKNLLNEIEISIGYKVDAVFCRREDLTAALIRNYGPYNEETPSVQTKEQSQKDVFRGFLVGNGDEVEVEFFQESEGEASDNAEMIQNTGNSAPIVKMVSSIVQRAIKMRASDIHLEPREDSVSLRYRIDGDLRTALYYEKSIQEGVISRIKILSNMDITNRRLPQDGSTKVVLGKKEVDLRVSTVPTIHGEKVVIRLLDQSTGIVPMQDLGMPKTIYRQMADIFNRPQGMLIVTGPTGSGKTTTLYACVNELRTDRKNIITIEDPVEYKLKGITQIQVKEDIGRTFPVILRAVLRQDPDIIKVGEIRDAETADIAMKAALTGHLVLSTVHTNNAVSVVTRLIDIGIPSYLISSALSGVLAQRLIRRICPHCKTQINLQAPDDFLALVKALEMPLPSQTYIGRGCDRCYKTGYLGRAAVYEFLPVTSNIRKLITNRSAEEDLTVAAKKEGNQFLLEDAWDKVLSGVSTIDEVIARIPTDYLNIFTAQDVRVFPRN